MQLVRRRYQDVSIDGIFAIIWTLWYEIADFCESNWSDHDHNLFKTGLITANNIQTLWIPNSIFHIFWETPDFSTRGPQTHLCIVPHLVDGCEGGDAVAWILVVRLGKDLFIGSRWAQIAGRLCGVVAGGGDILVVPTGLAGTATRIWWAREILASVKSSLVNIMTMLAAKCRRKQKQELLLCRKAGGCLCLVFLFMLCYVVGLSFLGVEWSSKSLLEFQGALMHSKYKYRKSYFFWKINMIFDYTRRNLLFKLTNIMFIWAQTIKTSYDQWNSYSYKNKILIYSILSHNKIHVTIFFLNYTIFKSYVTMRIGEF